MDIRSEIKGLLNKTDVGQVRLVKNNKHGRTGEDYTLHISDQYDVDFESLLAKVDFVSSVQNECRGKYQIKLNRSKIFKTTISLVNAKGIRYGHIDSKPTSSAMINVPNLFGTKAESSFDGLRALFITSSLFKLLQANSFQVSMARGEGTSDVESLIDCVLTPSAVEPPLYNQEDPISTDQRPEFKVEAGREERSTMQEDACCKYLATTKLFEEIKKRLERNEGLCEDLDEMNAGENVEKIKINIRKFLEENGLENEFSLNLNHFIISSSDDVVRELHGLEDARQRISNLPVSCVHVVHNKNYLQQQKVDATWRILNGHPGKQIAQVHLIYCKATTDDKHNPELDPKKLLLNRKSQIASAFKSKYGMKKAAFFTEEMMDNMTRASLRFEFLSIKPTVETKISAHSSCFEDRSGVFVFYNYARVATLMDKFNKLVAEGFYPPLPEVDQIDFECLKSEDEWDVLFNYILEFPDVVKDSVTKDSEGFIKSLATHKICLFLTSLSSSFSRYYSKTHILGVSAVSLILVAIMIFVTMTIQALIGWTHPHKRPMNALQDPLPHLLTTMQARLYLAISVKQVYSNALDLLSINPLERL